MSSTRLLILGVIRIRQPVHGYEVRQELMRWGAEQWANIAYGSIYHALNQMAKEGLLEPVDTGQTGQRPARTTYRLTTSGEERFQWLLHEAWWSYQPVVDPFMTALTMLPYLPAAEAAAALRHRADALRAWIETSRLAWHTKQMLHAPEHVREGFALGEARARGEIEWCEDLAGRLDRGEVPMPDQT